MSALTFLARALLDLVLPLSCPGCAAPGRSVCDACLSAVGGPPFAATPSPVPPGLPPCAAVTRYGGAARDLVLAYKEHGRRDLARPLGAALALAVGHAAGRPRDGPVILVPVPATVAAWRACGHDHVATLARRAAAALRAGGWPARVLPLLWVARSPLDQTGLDAASRAANLAHAFRARRMAVDHRLSQVVLVDDVLTTGATLAEAARALQEGAIQVTGAAVLAAALRRTAGSGTAPSAQAGRGARFPLAGRSPQPPAAEIA